MKRMVLWATLAVAVGCGLPASASAQPDYWDPRLDDLGVFWWPIEAKSGEWYWRIAEGRFLNEQEARGRHHIYYRCKDPDGNLLEDMLTWACWPTPSPTNAVWQLTKGPLDGYWANFAMAGGNW